MFKSSLHMKENQDQNIKLSQHQQHHTQQNSILQSKLFKFKKNTGLRKFGDPLLSPGNPFTTLLNLEQEHTALPVDTMTRKIPTQPYKVLDAPNLSDDFYLNLVDWSSSNILAVALGQAVYIWNACTSSVSQLCDLGEDNQVTSVGWSQKGNHLCVGNRNGEIQIWDVNQGKEIRTLTGHTNRVGSCSWSGS